MKGLFLFIKNNRIIYKVSIVSILILMLISVVQINPENIKKNSVGAIVIGYTIEFRASDGNFYNRSTGKVIDDPSSMGLISLGGNWGEGENPQGAVLQMCNCNITSTAEIALYINGDVYIYVTNGTENIINSAYKGSNANYYGIKSSGNIQFMGKGTLTVDYNNAINSDKVFTAIYSDRSIDIMQSNVIAKGNDYGIYSGENITVSSGNIEVSALGNNGVGMSVNNDLTVTGGNIISKGIGRAVQYSSLITTEDTELHTHTGVIIASTDIDCKSIEKYSNDNISSYKYMELGSICDYYLKYNSKTGELKKVLSTGTEENIAFEDVPGLKKSDTTDSYGLYTLILDGFNFVTSCKYGLYIDRGSTVVGESFMTVNVKSTNRIVVDYNGTELSTAIYCNSRTEINGAGSLDIISTPPKDNSKDKSERDKGIFVDSSLKLNIKETNIKIMFSGCRFVGIQAGSMECNDVKLDISINTSELCYGIMTEGMFEVYVKIINSNMKVDVKSDKADGYGIYSASGIIDVIDSSMVVKGNTRALNQLSMSSSSNEYDILVVEASTVYKDKLEDYSMEEGIEYPFISNIADYKYVKIGMVPTYHYKYVNTDIEKTLYKVKKDDTEIPLDSNLFPEGLSITEDGELLIDGFNFVTTDDKILDIVGATDPITINVSGNNSIRSIDVTENEYYGIYSNVNLVLNNTGLLNINCINYGYETSEKTYKGICSIKDITITSTDGDISREGIVFNIKEGSAYGLYGVNISLDKTYIDFACNMKNGAYCICGNLGDVTLQNNSTINAVVTSNIKDSEGEIIRTNGYIYTNGNINIKESKIEGKIYSGIARGVCVLGNKHSVYIDSSYMRFDIDTIGSSNKKAEDCGIHSKENLDIINSKIHCDINGKNKIRGLSTIDTNSAIIGTINIKGGFVEVNVEGSPTMNVGINANIININNKAKVEIKGMGSSAKGLQVRTPDETFHAGGGEVKIESAKLNIQVPDDGYAIMCGTGTKLSISASDCILKGKTRAINCVDSGSATIKPELIVKASEGYDGTLNDVTGIENNYRYVKINTTAISVDITWGDMDYIYTEGQWDTNTHQYDMGIWSTVNTNGNKIVITNNSINSINASITYDKDPGYNGTAITGTIVDTQGGSNVISTPRNILVDKSFEAYLKLSGKLDPAVRAKTVIGNVTVTIKE